MDTSQNDMDVPPLPDEDDCDFLKDETSADFEQAPGTSSSPTRSSPRSDCATLAPSPHLSPVTPASICMASNFAEASVGLDTRMGGFELGCHIRDGGHGSAYFGCINKHECVLKVVSESSLLLLLFLPDPSITLLSHPSVLAMPIPPKIPLFHPRLSD